MWFGKQNPGILTFGPSDQNRTMRHNRFTHFHDDDDFLPLAAAAAADAAADRRTLCYKNPS